MKRVYLCLAIFTAVIFTSMYCMNQLDDIYSGINSRVDTIIFTAESGDMEKAYRLTEELEIYWHESELKMMKYIRHNDIDIISISVARLPYLAKYSDLSELLSEAKIIKNIIHHVWDSEQLRPENII